MRTNKEISEFLNRLKVVWLAHPNLRFAQLVSNVASCELSTDDIFYIEDSEMIRAFEAYARNTGYIPERE